MPNKQHKKQERISARDAAEVGGMHYGKYAAYLFSTNSGRFILLYCLLSIYMLLNQGASTDLKIYPVWFFRAFTFIIFLLFCAIDGKRVRSALSEVNWKHPLFWLTIALLISSNIISIKPFATFSTSVNYIAYATLAFLIFCYIRDERDLRVLIEIVVSIGFLVAFWGLFVFYGGMGDRPLEKPLSTVFYWHNPAAGYFLLIFPICLAMYLSLRKLFPTFQMMWFFFIIFTAFGLTLSRGGWLSSFLSLLLIPLWLHYKGELRVSKLGGRLGQVVLAVALTAFALILSAVLWAMIYTTLKLAVPGFVLASGPGAILHKWLFAIILVICIAALFIPPILRGRFGEVRRGRLDIPARILLLFAVYIAIALPISFTYRGRFLKPIVDRWNQIRIDDFSAVGRFNFYGAGWQMFVHHPIIGTGFDTYGYYYPEYQNDPSFYSKDPHNVYLRFAQEGGIIGIGVMGFFLWQFLSVVRRLFKREDGNPLAVYQIGLAACVLAELQHLALDFDETFPIIPMLVISYTVILRNTYNFMGSPVPKPVKSVKKAQPAGTSRSKPAFYAAIGGGGILIIICIIIGISYVYFQRADDIETRAWLQDFANLPEGQKPDLRTLQANAAEEMLKYNTMAVRIFPYNPDALFNLARDHFIRADAISSGTAKPPSNAKEQFDYHVNEALKYSDRLMRLEYHDPKSNYYRGQILILAGRKDEAFEFLDRALELNPLNIPLFYVGVADYYFLDGQYDKALEKVTRLEDMLNQIEDITQREPNWLQELAGRRLDWQDLPEVYRKAMWVKGQVYLQWKDYEKADRAFRQGAEVTIRDLDRMSMDYENRYFNMELADIARRDGRLEEAQSLARKVYASYGYNAKKDDTYNHAYQLYKDVSAEIVRNKAQDGVPGE